MSCDFSKITAGDLLFNYAVTGLPDDNKMKTALAICEQVLREDQGLSEERIAYLIKNYSVYAAKLLLDNCEDCSEAAVLDALLFPALMYSSEKMREDILEQKLGKPLVDHLRLGRSVIEFSREENCIVSLDGVEEGAFLDNGSLVNTEMLRNIRRTLMIPGLVLTRAHLINCKEQDPGEHYMRWGILERFEKDFEVLKGENPALDKIYDEALKESRAAMEALGKRDAELKAVKKINYDFSKVSAKNLSFNYAETGLPDNDKMKEALAFCESVLAKDVERFISTNVRRVLDTHSIRNANLLINNANDYSLESVLFVLLIPALTVIKSKDDLELIAEKFGGRVMALNQLHSKVWVNGKPLSKQELDKLEGRELEDGSVVDAEMVRDIKRVSLLPALNVMADELIDCKVIDSNHSWRCDILKRIEKDFSNFLGENPYLDKLFEQSLAKSHASMEALTKAA